MRMNEKKSCPRFEWIHLFASFLIPVVIAIYTIVENNRELSIATHNRAQDIELAEDQVQDTILRDYQQSIGQLIEKYGSQLNTSISASVIARFNTLSTLNQINSQRRNFLINLLYEAKLITYEFSSDSIPISLEFGNLIDLCLSKEPDLRTITHLSIVGGVLTNANFRFINFEGAIFIRAKLNNADFSETTNLCVSDDIRCPPSKDPSLFFDHSNLTFAKFIRSTYQNATFTFAILKQANLHRFNCDSCKFELADLTRANLNNAHFINSQFIYANLFAANLDESKFEMNSDFYGSDLIGSSAIRSNFTQCRFQLSYLTSAKFDYTTIENSSFEQAHLEKSSFQSSRLIRVDFTRANLYEANWKYVRCEYCRFYETIFDDVDMANAIFIECDFRNSQITDYQLKQTSSLRGSILPNGTQIDV